MAQILKAEVKDDSWSTFLRVQVRLDDGAVVWRQVEHHGSAVAVLPYDPQRRVALIVRLFRAPALYAGMPDRVVEPVAGMIDEGETAEAAVRREALEEVGVRLGDLETVAEAWASPGISTERMTLFLARYAAADRVAAGGGAEGEHEGIEVIEAALADLGRNLDARRIDDMKLLALVQALKLRQPELFA